MNDNRVIRLKGVSIYHADDPFGSYPPEIGRAHV